MDLRYENKLFYCCFHVQQAAHTASGAADGADAVMAERSTAPVQHPVSHVPDEVEMSIGPSPAGDDQRSRVYIMISKKGKWQPNTI